MKVLPKTFKFSPLLSFGAILISVAMFWASSWQWSRYKYKLELVETYESHSTVEPLKLPEGPDYTEVLHKKVKLRGTWDYTKQVYVINRRWQFEAGYWLLTPLKLQGRDKTLIVSRGFIPFGEDTPEEWEQYDFSNEAEIEAVIQESIPPRTFLTPVNETEEGVFQRKWLYPDVERMQKQFPYPLETAIFAQMLGGPPTGTYPAESVSIRVPPSTHFWYSIEWVLLGLAVLGLSFWLQAFPRRKKAPRDIAQSTNAAYN